jgi:hypothetical protein
MLYILDVVLAGGHIHAFFVLVVAFVTYQITNAF